MSILRYLEFHSNSTIFHIGLLVKAWITFILPLLTSYGKEQIVYSFFLSLDVAES